MIEVYVASSVLGRTNVERLQPRFGPLPIVDLCRCSNHADVLAAIQAAGTQGADLNELEVGFAPNDHEVLMVRGPDLAR